MLEQITNLLKGVRPDVDYAAETSLIDGKILDSFDVVSLVAELKDAFDIDITIEDLTPENFNSAAAICAMVEKLQNAE